MEENKPTDSEILDSQLKEMRLEILGDVEDDDNDELFTLMLKKAQYIALEILYPFDKEIMELPMRIREDWQVRCAVELYNSIGEAGYRSYSENGLSYSKDSGSVSEQLLKELVPNAGVPR